jgi:hypothetical protein
MKKQNYLQDNTLSLNDELIGVDADDASKTKTYTIQSIIDFIQSNIDLGVNGTFTTTDGKTITVVNGCITSVV